MEVVKDPRNIVLAAIAVGWGGSTVHFYKKYNSLQDEIKVLSEKVGKHIEQTNMHTKNFEAIKTMFERISETEKTLRIEIEDVLEDQKNMNLYFSECLELLKQNSTTSGQKVDFKVLPKIDYSLGRRKKIRRRKQDDSDDEEPRRRRSPVRPRQDRDRSDRRDLQDRRYDSEDDIASQLSNYRK